MKIVKYYQVLVMEKKYRRNSHNILIFSDQLIVHNMHVLTVISEPIHQTLAF